MAITLDLELVTRLVREALAEDRAAEDATTPALVTPDQRGRGAIIAPAASNLEIQDCFTTKNSKPRSRYFST